jgi:hypothetical protein
MNADIDNSNIVIYIEKEKQEDLPGKQEEQKQPEPEPHTQYQEKLEYSRQYAEYKHTQRRLLYKQIQQYTEEMSCISSTLIQCGKIVTNPNFFMPAVITCCLIITIVVAVTLLVVYYPIK